LSAAYDLTPRARLTVADRVSRGFARQTSGDLLTGARLLFPNAITRANNLGGSLAYEVSRRTQVHGSVQYDQINFDNSDESGGTTPAVGDAVLAGGGTVGSRVSVQRLVTSADTLGLVHEFSTSNTGVNGQRATTHAFRALWQRPAGRKFTLSFEGGLNVYSIESLNGVAYAPTGAVTVARRVGRNTLAVRVERFIEVYGSTHVSEVFSPTYSFALGRNLTVGLDGTFARNTFPADPRYDYHAWIGGANIRYTLPANLLVTAAYTHWDRAFSRGPALATTAYYSSVSVGYARSWR
jgi:hypothetical protein